MDFQIKEIILWPKNTSFKPRRVEFNIGQVNVITGASRTGKSAIIPIIDYCLGSERCTIPVNTIRNTCSWFGVIVQTPLGQKLFARREPGQQKSTSDMFVAEGVSLVIPEKIDTKNSNTDSVKRILDELAGLTALDFDAEGLGYGFKGRPSFRDLGAFIFQPQNIVANPDVLFYKADTYEHREKLKTIFPYVLNAITPELMAKQHELVQLSRELRRKQNELSSVRQVSERWLAEIQARVSEAKELGLIKETVPTTATQDQLINLLSKVVQMSNETAKVTTETISEAIAELTTLQQEEDTISLELSGFRRRMAEMSALKQSASQYQEALQIQRDRLQVSEWLKGLHDPNHDCPLCGNSLNSTKEPLDLLFNSLQEIEKTAGEFSTIPAAFDREFERIRAGARELAEKLEGVKLRRRTLERSSEEAKQRQYDSLGVSRFIGNIEQAIQTYKSIGQDSDLENEVRELQERVNDLSKEISAAQIQNKTRRALSIVCSNAQKLLPNLDLERPNDPLSLSIEDLTIKVTGIDRDDYLWEIGSGSNWLSYHIAVSLGLQQFFLSLKHSPVPSFLVYDQPSQVYFPKKLAKPTEDTQLDPELLDEDIEAVQKIFKVFTSAVENSKGRLQVIILDHAADNVWGEIRGVHLVQEWRGDEKLVPLT